MAGKPRLGLLANMLRRRAPASRLKQDNAASALLDSVEYELAQLARSVREVKLDKPRTAWPLPASDPAAFEAKLRNPARRKSPEWWAALGLDA